MRKTAILLMSATLLTGIGLSGSAVARDRSDRAELTASQMTDRAEVRTAKMKVDLNLTADQEQNWAEFATAMQDMSKTQADRRVALRDARAQQHGTLDALDEMRKTADTQIELSNDLKKLADAAQPLYASLNEQQKSRFVESLLGGDRERDAY
jgi:LTXXQ motif family protein